MSPSEPASVSRRVDPPRAGLDSGHRAVVASPWRPPAPNLLVGPHATGPAEAKGIPVLGSEDRAISSVPLTAVASSERGTWIAGRERGSR